MDGMLSQEEINALLNGVASGEVDIDQLAADTPAPDQPPVVDVPQAEAVHGEVSLSDTEKDAIGEIANISMGTSATTLYSLVNTKVNITTPEVDMATWETVTSEYEKPCVFIQIKYTVGLDGANILILREEDVKIIADLMMGGDGTNTDGELNELHLSAISEAMNQMMGSAATSLSSMLGRMIDISPPEASQFRPNEAKKAGEVAPFLEGTFVKICFRMQIGDLIDSTIMQLYPVDFARSLYEIFMGQTMGAPEPEPEPAPAPAPAPAPMPTPEPMPYMPPQADMSMQPQPQMAMPPMMDMSQMGYGMPPMGYAMPPMQPQPNMNIQQAQFQSFSQDYAAMTGHENIDLIMDVPLEVTVELGRTKKSIAEILDFTPGTIIELNRIAGEPIDVLVNGKFVARGEVVVIEESFGIRVTEIINENKGV